MNKILLIKPSMKRPISPETGDIGILLNLYSLSTYLQERLNIDTKVFDERLNALQKTDKEDIEEVIKKYSIIGISVSSSDLSRSIEIARIIKKIDPNKIVFFGGIFVFSNEEYLLNNYPEIDYLISGEGEMPLLELMTCLINDSAVDVRAVSFRRNGVNIINNTPSYIPLKDIPIVKIPKDILERYKPYDNGSVYASRGCANSCEFCTISKFWEHSNRRRDIKDVIEEIRHYHDCGFKQVSFKDENFLVSKEWSSKLLYAIKELKFDMKIKIKSRLDLIDYSQMELYKNAGVTEIQIGIEDIIWDIFNDSKKYPKPISRMGFARKCLNTLRAMSDNKIRLNCIFMFGLYGTSPEFINENMKYIKWMYRKFPDTKFYFTCLATQPYENYFHTEGKYLVLNNDLDYYTHLYPVSIPKSLIIDGDWRKALKIITTKYNEIVKHTHTESLNPLITDEYISLLHPVKNELKVY